MKQFVSGMGRRIANGIITGLSISLTIAGVAYALSYNWSDPTSIRDRKVGNPLTSAGWNLLVGNVDNLNERLAIAEGSGGIVPTGAIMAFNLMTCPNGWSEADGGGTPARPDLRGEFIRGWNRNTTGTDNSRSLGSWQDSTSIRNYAHSDGAVGALAAIAIFQGNSDGAGTAFVGGNSTYYMSAGGVVNGGAIYGSASRIRPRNVALLYCIKN